MLRLKLSAVLAVVLLCSAAHAQVARPKPNLTSIADADAARAGANARVALGVVLPAGLHVQSDKPRDPSLIPTVLTVTPPPGVRVVEIVYPTATDLTLSGASQPLAVFGARFAIGVRLAVAPDVPPGDIVIPARFRYQACNDSSCFPPATETTQWTVRIAAADAAIAPQHRDVFDAIHFSARP